MEKLKTMAERLKRKYEYLADEETEKYERYKNRHDQERAETYKLTAILFDYSIKWMEQELERN